MKYVKSIFFFIISLSLLFVSSVSVSQVPEKKKPKSKSHEEAIRAVNKVNKWDKKVRRFSKEDLRKIDRSKPKFEIKFDPFAIISLKLKVKTVVSPGTLLQDITTPCSVNFEDTVLESIIRAKLEKNEDEVIFCDEVNKIYELTIIKHSIESLAGLEHFTGLKNLTIVETNITSLDPIKNLGKMKELIIYGSQVTHIPELNMPQLTLLVVTASKLTSLNLANLANCTGLEELYAWHNEIEDIGQLPEGSSLPNLWLVDLSYNKITSPYALPGIPSISTLFLGHNPFSNLNLLLGMPNLYNLGISSTNVVNLQAAAFMPKLSALQISFSKVQNLCPLVDCEELSTLTAFCLDLFDTTTNNNCISQLEMIGYFAWSNINEEDWCNTTSAQSNF